MKNKSSFGVVRAILVLSQPRALFNLHPFTSDHVRNAEVKQLTLQQPLFLAIKSLKWFCGFAFEILDCK